MTSTFKIAFAGAALIVVVVVGVACSPAAVSQGSKPSPSLQPATASSAPSPSPLDTSTWTTWVSKRYDFTIGYPADWVAEPAEHDWTLTKDAAWPNGATDHFVGGPEGEQVAVSVWSVAVDRGTTADSWLSAYCRKNNIQCTGISDRAIAAKMDGHPGTIVGVDVDEIPHAIFLVDRRIYVIACWRSDADPAVLRYSGSFRLVEAFLSTMHLLPG